MSAAAETTDTPPERAPRVADGLVELVRRLVIFGRDLLDTLQRGNTGFPSVPVARRFGTISLAMIIARLTRGLLIAQALEARLLRRRGPRPVPPAPRKAPATPSAPRAPRTPPIDEEAELRGTLPTAEQIAERIRRKPIGAVFVEICRDLGINPQHPDWQDINRAIIIHYGNLVKLVLHWVRLNQEIEAIAALAGSAAQAEPPPPATIHPP